MLKGASDRRWMTIIMQLTSMAAGAVAVAFMPMPPAHNWPWLVAGALLHIGYSAFLVRALSLGELGEIYPISRGASPVLVAAGSLVFAGDRLSLRQMLGIAVVSLGILSLRRASAKAMPLRAILTALVTAGFTAAYTIIDGMGARQAEHVGAYIGWLWILDGLFVGGWFYLFGRRREGDGPPSPRQTGLAVTAGLLSMAAYSAVILATTLGAIGAVSALRETSVLFAALIGGVFLRERLTAARVLACIGIAAGAVLIAA